MIIVITIQFSKKGGRAELKQPLFVQSKHDSFILVTERHDKAKQAFECLSHGIFNFGRISTCQERFHDPVLVPQKNNG